MKLSIIFVTYKCVDKFKVALDAVLASKVGFDYEIIIVDNDSQDGTVEMVEEEYLNLRSQITRLLEPTEHVGQEFGMTDAKSSKTISSSVIPEATSEPASAGYVESKTLAPQVQNSESVTSKANGVPITLIKNTNEGFAKGNNRGLKVAKGEYKLLLNPDTKVAPDALQIMMDFMESTKAKELNIGISTCKLVKGDGKLDLACRRSLPDPWNSLMRVTGLSFLFPKSKVVSGYNLTNTSEDDEMEVGACVGAFMLISPQCFEAVGLLDEQFWMYGEDLDYCKSAGEKGFKVWYYPKTTTLHLKGQSSRKNSKQALFEFHNVMWKYYKKHLEKQYPFFLNWLVYVGIWARYVLQLTKNAFRKEAIVSK